MSHEKNKELDQLLRQWQSDRSATDDELARLHAKIVGQMLAPDQAATKCDPRKSWPAKNWRIGVLLSAAAAAALLMAAICLTFAGANRGLQKPVDSVGQAVTLPGIDLAQQRKLLAEMQGMFDQQILWLAETNNQLQMKLQSDADSGDSSFVA